MSKLTILLVAVVAALAVASATSAMQPPVGVQAHPSKYGTVIFDRRGFALYAFTADSATASACSGDCAAAWPPLLTEGKPHALRGIAAGKLGRIQRPDGTTQVTYAGHPLYFYVGDRQPAQILCQNVSEFGGLWLVVRANGRLVK